MNYGGYASGCWKPPQNTIPAPLKKAVLDPLTFYFAAIFKKTAAIIRLWTDILRSTTTSKDTPGPKPAKTPHSNPSPLVLFPSILDLFLISSNMKITLRLNMFPYWLNTFLDALSFSSFNPSLFSILSKIAGPPG
ncbi:hypothetical protein Ahy_A07g033817 [Arachis hypogaea]|uniref:Uncharacterized protein n=1 Tax=Arachis hypogaea TaxID=3818 RepID=A0A445CAG7_ARAHY|nr:hypothetical protein Ahy_A07g033817 [Arachis hypogaea]